MTSNDSCKLLACFRTNGTKSWRPSCQEMWGIDRRSSARFLRNLGEKWTGCLLVYSGVLKNMELVPDAEKRAHLANVLQGWSHFTYHTLLLVPQLVKHRKMRVNGVEYRVLFPERMTDGEVARGIYLATPRAVSEMLRFYLSTEKMEVQLREPTLSEGLEPLIVTFYRGCLYGDMRMEGFINVLGTLESILSRSRYPTEAFVWKLRQMLVRLPLTDREDAEFRRLVAGAVGRLLPGSPAERGRRMSREMHRLGRDRLVRQLRLQVRQRAEE